MLKNPDPSLINDDIAPTPLSERRWSVLNMAALWIGMVVCVPTYMLSGGLVESGMNWWQAVLTVSLGNAIVLVPMILNGHPGTKYGIPFPVLARASFGIYGANIAAVMRGLVACGWFGIQTWIGGSAIYQLLIVLMGPSIATEALPILGINLAQFGCFLVFWAAQVAIIWRGIESIKHLETLAAPFLVLMGFLLLGWAYVKADGFGPMLSAPSQFIEGGAKEGQFWRVFFPSLTAMVGFWATLSLNIPDFTRYAKTQRDQILGQAIGLPTFMTLFAFIGVAVTSATVVIYGEAISDPTALLGKMGGGMSIVLSLIALTVATLSTNIAANVVSPANAIMNIAPHKVSFRTGAMVTAGLGVAMFPWKLLASAGDYIFTWLIGYSALLGAIGGILIVDYYLLRKTELDLEALYQKSGRYWYKSGYNAVALAALAVGILPNVPGFLAQSGLVEPSIIPEFFKIIYTYAWFVGFALAGLTHMVLMRATNAGGSLEP
ncbi:MAG: NCS1 family nucleobase:cation symporter-1 [Bradymonadaceae bacterium]|nr:NCS1 family nucleobase:cation symporter-1 [Lujinxingiaceae bacterium]